MQSKSCHNDNKGIYSEHSREGTELRSQHLNQAQAEEGLFFPPFFLPREKNFYAQGLGLARGGVFLLLCLSGNPINSEPLKGTGGGARTVLGLERSFNYSTEVF